MSDLSGKEWWKRNQARYPNSRELSDLDPSFRPGAVKFIQLLRDGGATVTVTSTLRNPIRAYLMHYSWRIAHGDIDPANVPARAGVTIKWDQGDIEASRKAAREMVRLFNLAYRPSLTSNHIRGKAVDMRIRWRGNLILGRFPTVGSAVS